MQPEPQSRQFLPTTNVVAQMYGLSSLGAVAIVGVLRMVHAIHVAVHPTFQRHCPGWSHTSKRVNTGPLFALFVSPANAKGACGSAQLCWFGLSQRKTPSPPIRAPGCAMNRRRCRTRAPMLTDPADRRSSQNQGGLFRCSIAAMTRASAIALPAATIASGLRIHRLPAVLSGQMTARGVDTVPSPARSHTAGQSRHGAKRGTVQAGSPPSIPSLCEWHRGRAMASTRRAV